MEPRTADWRALGTGVRLVVVDGDLDAARSAVEDILAAVDLAYSRFRDDSEIVGLNARAGAVVALSPLLGRAIDAALRAAAATGGAVDPTVGRAMRAIGYDADFDRIRNPAGPIELRLEPIPGWQSVRLSANRSEVQVRRGVELDLGSVGKGLASDLSAAAALVAMQDVATAPDRCGVLVSLGGDIACAGSAPDGGWRILISEDSDTPADAPGEVVAIQTGALATSSTTVRRWRRGDADLHHLIDPRTGGSVDSPWRTASVAAASCVDANTAATASIVLGDAAVAWLGTAGLPARLVARDGSVTRVGGWPEPDDPPEPADAPGPNPAGPESSVVLGT